MNKLLLILLCFLCTSAYSQTLYIPTNPDSLRLTININGMARAVRVGDLIKNKLNISDTTNKWQPKGVGGGTAGGNYHLPYNSFVNYYLGGDSALHILPTDAATLNGHAGGYYLDYDNFINKPDLSSLHSHTNKAILDNITASYTTAEQTKLAGIAAGATANSNDATLLNRANHTGVQAATTITEDATHRFATDAEKSTWNGKQDALGFTPYNATNPNSYISRSGISATGSLSYNSTTGVISYTQPDYSTTFQPVENQRLSSTNAPSFAGGTFTAPITITAQGSTPAAPAANTNIIYGNAIGVFTIMGSNGFGLSFNKSRLTASHQIYAQNKDMTVADSAAVAANTFATPTSTVNNLNIRAYGNSLTAGAGVVAPYDYPSQLSALTGYNVINNGVGGETSTQIANRLVADSAHKGYSTIIWEGRNNYTDSATVLADIARSVAALGHNRYLVLGIINGNYPAETIGQTGYIQINALNARLAAIYGVHYVPMREYLVSLYNPASGNDIATHNLDVTPYSLRSDSLHLNAAGYLAVATKVAQYINILQDTTLINTTAAIVTAQARPTAIGGITPNKGTFTALKATSDSITTSAINTLTIAPFTGRDGLTHLNVTGIAVLDSVKIANLTQGSTTDSMVLQRPGGYFSRLAAATGMPFTHSTTTGSGAINTRNSTDSLGIGVAPTERLTVNGGIKSTGNNITTANNTYALGDNTNNWARVEAWQVRSNNFLTLNSNNVGGGILFQRQAVTKITMDANGKLLFDATVTAAGTTGNQTINKAAGTVNIAAGGTSITVTNSLVTTSSLIDVQLRTNDATAWVKNYVSASGSFTINLGAAATGEVSIHFIVYN